MVFWFVQDFEPSDLRVIKSYETVHYFSYEIPN